MARIDSFFKFMKEQNASDLHLSTGNPPMLRIHGELVRVDMPSLASDDLKALVYEIAPEHKIKTLRGNGRRRLRLRVPRLCALSRKFLQPAERNCRCLPSDPEQGSHLEDLGLPPVLKRFSMLKKGLVLVTGPTGSGKSTTLAAMVDYANLHRKDHIITVEDPIEFVHRSQQSLINHREVGLHTKSFAARSSGALREDPDIILVGEMRDLGDHRTRPDRGGDRPPWSSERCTPRARPRPSTVSSTSFRPASRTRSARRLSESLKGVVAQNLFRRIDKPGRVAALEVLVCDTPIANLIREAKTHQIPGMMQVGKKKGNQPLDDAIMEHLRAARISPEEAYEKAIDKKKFRVFLKTPPDDFED